MKFEIREVRESDLKEIIEIYTPYIKDSSVSFETVLPTIEEMKDRMRQFKPYGFWVAVDPNTQNVLGYAYGASHRTRAAYRWCCEVSLYMRESAQRKGIGSALYKKLFEELRKKNYYNAYAVITLPNEKSVKLHESLGFQKTAHYSKIGFKFGAWHDVGWWALRLQESDQAPAEPLS